MFSNLKDFVDGGANLELNQGGEPTPQDVKVATVSILLKMAHADNSVDQEEINAIYTAVKSSFAVDQAEAEELMSIAENLRKNEKKTTELVQAINENFSVEQRQQILGVIWKVVKADGIVDKYELEYATRVRALLNLSLEQALAARALAES